MPSFQVERSIRIEAPLDTVRPLVRDFRQWPRWSPWLVAEPETKLDFSDDGRSYSWDGRFTGAGSLTLDDEAPVSLKHTIRFLRPFRSTSKVGFTFKEDGGATTVTWTMSGSLPFFLFFMKPMMAAWIGSDYRRGLLMLKDLAETGEVLSKIDFQGVEEVSAIDFVGIRNGHACSNIGPEVRRDFERLGDWLSSNSLVPSGPMFMICHKWDLVRDHAECTCAVPLAASPDPLPDGFHAGTTPGGRAYVLLHTGAYRHLGNAWAAGMMRARGKEFRSLRGVAPMEIYRNTPGETPEAELVAEVRMPAR